jgi:hypothetical protein
MQDTCYLGNCVYKGCHPYEPYETHFISLFVNTLIHHQKYSHDRLFNVYETPTETGLRVKRCENTC